MKTSLALGLTALFASAANAAEPPPISDFVRHSTYSSAEISPNGEYLALTVDRGGQDVLTVLRLSDLSLVKVNTLPEDKSVAGVTWVSDDRLMFTATRKLGSYASPFLTGEWFAVNADGSMPRPVIHFGARSSTERNKAVGNQRFQLLDPLEDDPRNVLMLAYYQRTNNSSGVELVQVDTLSGARKTLARAPRDNCSLSLDEKKQARFAICSDARDASGRFDTVTELYRLGDDGQWALVNSSKNGGEDLTVLGTADDGRIYAFRSDRKNPSAFGLLDRQTAQFTELFRDPVSSVSNIMASPKDDTVFAVVTEAGAPEVHMIDEAHPDAQLYLSLAGAFPGQLVDFSSATRDGDKIIVSVYSDRNPGELYLYDRKTGQARFLMKNRNWMDTSRSASVIPFALTSRDGLKLHGYLTVPHGVDPKNLPMVVNPHGGPMGPRDDWGYNWETQLLASRGYAVLQVNFRGSGGFGKAFEDMAYGQWATGIMNDIADATKWAIEKGYADKDRVCIYGGSFGGYAAIMGPATHPGLFKCAFGYVGAYDPQIQFKLSDTSKREDGLAYMRRAFGPSRAEQDAMSPVLHADKVNIPVYLAAGARDARCPPENTEAMFKALEQAGNKPEGMIIQTGEGHGFYEEKARENLYTEMLAFFGRHIGRQGEVTVGTPAAAEGSGGR